MAVQTAGVAVGDGQVDVSLRGSFGALCSGAGIPSSRWNDAWAAMMTGAVRYDSTVPSQVALDTALRAWWSKASLGLS